MRVFILSILLLLLTGCSTLCTNYCESSLITTNTVNIDPRVLESCKPQLLLDTSSITFEQVLLNVKENTFIYNECAGKQRDSVIIIKKFANIKDDK